MDIVTISFLVIRISNALYGTQDDMLNHGLCLKGQGCEQPDKNNPELDSEDDDDCDLLNAGEQHYQLSALRDSNLDSVEEDDIPLVCLLRENMRI